MHLNAQKNQNEFKMINHDKTQKMMQHNVDNDIWGYSTCALSISEGSIWRESFGEDIRAIANPVEFQVIDIVDIK